MTALTKGRETITNERTSDTMARIPEPGESCVGLERLRGKENTFTSKVTKKKRKGEQAVKEGNVMPSKEKKEVNHLRGPTPFRSGGRRK